MSDTNQIDGPTFGQVIRARRILLALTHEEMARRIKTSTPYIGHLEEGKRHPSDKIVTRLAEVLGLDRRELFFLANPRARALLKPGPEGDVISAWVDFRKNEQIRRIHNITSDEKDAGTRRASRPPLGSFDELRYLRSVSAPRPPADHHRGADSLRVFW